MILKDKVALITGSAAGIGAATALRFAREGAKVVVNYSKSADEADAVGRQVREAGGEALIVQANVAEDEDCRKLAAATLDAFGRIDILVNNAGTTQFADHADLEALGAEEFHAIYAVNVIGPYQMIRASAPAMKAQGDGRVVNVSSIAGVVGIGSSVPYAASKGALNTMTLSLARALAPEIRVNAVCPGFVGTRWFRDKFGDDAFEKIKANVEANTPLKKAGTPESVAEAILFFCGPGADHISGETLLTDAGTHLGFAPLKAR